jgi:hypothetical protein
LIPKLAKDFIAVGKTNQFLVKILEEFQSCQKYGDTQGRQMTRNDLEESCLWAYYFERWAVIHK